MAVKKQNYLNNKDILKEIHKSKMTYCYVEDVKYDLYDLILDDISEITETAVVEAKTQRANRVQQNLYNEAIATYEGAAKNKPRQKDFAVDLDTISEEDLVFRVMTYEHIPEEEGRRKNPKTEADEKSKVNFPPFKHYVLEKGAPKEVVRSHWKGDLASGEFSVDHGRITNTLGTMFLKLVERYSHRANWRGYTYVDEMRGQALLQLSYIGLKFNEAKSDNPFAYYTAAVNNSFTRVLNVEKKNQTIRDDILIEQGHLPSYSRQLAHEEEMRKLRETVEADLADAVEAYGE